MPFAAGTMREEDARRALRGLGALGLKASPIVGGALVAVVLLRLNRSQGSQQQPIDDEASTGAEEVKLTLLLELWVDLVWSLTNLTSCDVSPNLSKHLKYIGFTRFAMYGACQFYVLNGTRHRMFASILADEHMWLFQLVHAKEILFCNKSLNL
jgi:hypothetical protein